MADQPTPKDSLGRLIQADVAEIRNLLSKNDMGKPVEHGSKKDVSDAVKKLSEIIGGDFAKDLKAATENLKKITNKLNKKKPEKKSDSCCEKLLDAIKGLGKINSNIQDMVDKQEKVIKATEALAKSGGGGGGNAAALAAASGSGEMSASFKNFRHHPDMENFYRFIFENDLRHEARAIMNQRGAQKQAEKAAKKAVRPAKPGKAKKPRLKVVEVA